ncbi:MAG: MFS transporter, partial [Caulobacteraceae bacterium]
LGRRLPPMLLGAPLMGLAMGFLFAPPTRLGELPLFAWLTVGTIGVRSFISLFNVPYFALGGEMSADYAERSSIVAWRAVAGILVGVALTAIAFSVFFRGADGLRHASAYPAFGWTVATVISAASLLCCLGTWRFAAALPSPRGAHGALWRRMPGEVAEIFRTGSFRILFLSSVVFSIAVGLNATLANHASIFAWKLRSDSLQILTYAYLVGILAGVGLMPALSARMEKKTAVIIGVIMVAVNWLVLPGLRGVGIIHFTGVEALWPLAINGLIVGVGVGFLAVAYPSMMADAADEHEYLSGHRREGLYFAGLGFAGKAASGLGALTAGFSLDLIGFPRHAASDVGASIAEPVLRRLM